MCSQTITIPNPNTCSCASSSNKITEWVFLVTLLLFNTVYTNGRSPHKQCVPGINPHNPGAQCGYPDLSSADPALGYPVRENTVSGCKRIGLLVWLLVFALNLGVIVKRNEPRRIYRIAAIKFEILMRSAFFSVVINEAITTTIKVSVGRPRPNYLSNDNEGDRIQSFPSGHTSFVFAIFFLMSLYLFRALSSARKSIYSQRDHSLSRNSAVNNRNGTVGTERNENGFSERNVPLAPLQEEVAEIDPREDMPIVLPMEQFVDPMNGDSYWCIALISVLKHVQILWVLIALAPTIGAVYVGCTRLTDYKHHYSDVLGGALIGIGCSVLSFWYHHSEFYYGFQYDADQQSKNEAMPPVRNLHNMAEINV